MTSIFKSLEAITTGYTVFEHDQVLTHDQLNSLSDYADDQIRLTRVKLLGVGLACGLRPSLSVGNVDVRVTKGVGVTTDGDLLYLDGTTIYTHFRLYDQTYPGYTPFYQGGNLANPMLFAYELLTNGSDPNAHPMTDFASFTGRQLSNMTAVLMMESWRKDDDLCGGDDCDNLGIEALNTRKLIVIDRASVAVFFENITTPAKAFLQLSQVAVERPVMTPSVQTAPQLAAAYRASCANINTALNAPLTSIYPLCSGFISDVFATDPSGAWITKLNQIRTAFSATDVSIQYYYDFLKDVAETYNAFCDLLYGDSTLCSPAITNFPKHLLLGDLVPNDPDANRTGFYPSPLASRTSSELDRAKFLLKKLDLMIANFDVNIATPDLRITPSSFEDRVLEDRAIPYYYTINTSNQFSKYWSFANYRRHAETRNQGYNASLWGGPTNPLHYQMGRNDFFRIEGHLGKNVTTMMTAIKSAITANNLPFAVQAIHVGTDRVNVTVKPAIRYSPLHQISYVMRQDVARQLDDVVSFSGALKAKVDAEPTTVNVDTEVCNCAPRAYATTQSVDLVNKATTVRAKLDRPYAAYVADTSWTDSMKNTLISAGQYKQTLSAVAKTDFLSPADGLMVSPNVTLLPSIDTLIKKNEDAEDDKLLLTNFVKCHPSIEHFAGVARGGTFVLVYDTNNLVVADFMLPYYMVDCPATPIDEPSLPRPDIKTTYVVNDGVKIQPSRTTVVNNIVTPAISGIRAEVNSTVDNKLDVHTASVNSALQFQNSYVGLFQSSIGMLGGAAPRADQVAYTNAAVRQADTLDIQSDAMTRSAVANESTAAFTGQMATSAGQMATSTGQMAASTGQIATSTGQIATSHATVAASNTQMAASSAQAVTAANRIATANESQATSAGTSATAHGTIAAQTTQMATSAAQSVTAANRIATAGESRATSATASATSQATIAAQTTQMATSAAQSVTAANRIATANESQATSAGASATSHATIAAQTTQIATSAGTSATAHGTIAAQTTQMATSAAQSVTAANRIATAGESRATSTGQIATSTGSIATSTGSIATSTGQVATSTGQIATSAGQTATASGRIATAGERTAAAGERSASAHEQTVGNVDRIATAGERSAVAGERSATAQERSADAAETGAAGGGVLYNDNFLTALANENKASADKVSALRAMAAAGDGTQFAVWCNDEASTVEQELSDSTWTFIQYIDAHLKYDDAAAFDISATSDAYAVAQRIIADVAVMSIRSIKDDLRQRIDNVIRNNNPDLQALLQPLVDALS